MAVSVTMVGDRLRESVVNLRCLLFGHDYQVEWDGPESFRFVCARCGKARKTKVTD